jgi:hypothetical protein
VFFGGFQGGFNMSIKDTQELLDHANCKVEIAYYGNRLDPHSITLECMECGTVLLEFRDRVEHVNSQGDQDKYIEIGSIEEEE